MFYFKNDSFYLEKNGTVLGVGIFGEQVPPAPLIPPPLTVPLQGQWERFTGTISWFRRRYKGPKVKG